METRSKTTKKLQYMTFVFDFDEASKEWNANKRKVGNGCYKYICNFQCKSGNLCKREAKCHEEYCSTHLRKNISIKKIQSQK
jgi:hypothetical protein